MSGAVQESVSLEGKTLFITGGSRGIGLAIALRAARDGANVVIAAKTSEPDPRLPGTIHSAVEEINAFGGHGLACVCDVRSDEQIQAAVTRTVETFGGIDILINNASALFLTGTLDTPAKRFDLVHAVNVRGTFLTSQACLPHLRHAANPHILMLAPPLNIEARWFAPHLAYSLSKFGMSLCVLGMAEEFRSDGIAVNALWPRTAIATAAVRNLLGGDDALRRCRKPEIVADAAHSIVSRPSRECSGHFFIDDDVLRADGISNLSNYAVDPTTDLLPDFFV
ncbi:MAG: NAD(P)-dependent oxidoreductase [Planctomycetia bacterium]|nr:NAD(P)-dependent oxidoreductase [Planctomycetia bacterium]